MERKSTGIVIGVVIAIIVFGAGLLWLQNDSDDSGTASQNTQQTEQTQGEPAQQEQQPSSDIVELAVATNDLSTLVTAVTAADLVATLQGDGPFTVLAPTNAAFVALPEGTLDSLLLPENKTQLADVLTYHVISGTVMSSDLTDGQVVETVQGAKLTVNITDDGVYFVDANGGKAMVATADVEASNGVVHIIDAVLLP